jgi:hypothetical protein
MVIGGSPVIGQGSGTNVLQSFSDATAGRSLQLYYGVASTNSAGTSYVLSRDAGISDPNRSIGSSVTYNFDMTVNRTTSFSGIGYVDFYMKQTNGGSFNITCSIYHYDGSTETLISDAPATTTLTVTSDQDVKLVLNVTRTAFKPGDTLRLKCVVSASAGTSELYHDAATAGQELKLWLPVVNLE